MSATASSVARSLEDLGYRVDQVEAKHGCWKVEAMNDSNIPIEALYDAAGELLAASLDARPLQSAHGADSSGP